jgi:hypothetical protein
MTFALAEIRIRLLHSFSELRRSTASTAIGQMIPSSFQRDSFADVNGCLLQFIAFVIRACGGGFKPINLLIGESSTCRIFSVLPLARTF